MIAILLDCLLIVLLAAGLFYASRLLKQLAALRASRADMERFVMDFNAAVLRAESSIKGLKQAARHSGDDLEQLLEKGQKMVDELNLIIGSADQIASRLSETATGKVEGVRVKAEPKEKPAPPAPTPAPAKMPEPRPASAAEKDLLEALEKLK